MEIQIQGSIQDWFFFLKWNTKEETDKPKESFFFHKKQNRLEQKGLVWLHSLTLSTGSSSTPGPSASIFKQENKNYCRTQDENKGEKRETELVKHEMLQLVAFGVSIGWSRFDCQNLVNLYKSFVRLC